ncbi:hypothetical protein O206_23820 [Ochrobactrum sp. EGD-AQ16]|nr:hypothetical protein O206_23820 [Ochrobactrum sp. EGD-AQ16]
MFLINVFEEETLCQRWERWRLLFLDLEKN